MPFIPAIGAALGFSGTAAAVAGTVATAAGAAALGSSIYQGQKQATAAKKASSAASAQNAAALQSVKDAQAKASTNAQQSLDSKVRARAAYSNIFTSPLGIAGQATTARKTLLGQ